MYTFRVGYCVREPQAAKVSTVVLPRHSRRCAVCPPRQKGTLALIPQTLRGCACHYLYAVPWEVQAKDCRASFGSNLAFQGALLVRCQSEFIQTLKIFGTFYYLAV